MAAETIIEGVPCGIEGDNGLGIGDGGTGCVEGYDGAKIRSTETI